MKPTSFFLMHLTALVLVSTDAFTTYSNCKHRYSKNLFLNPSSSTKDNVCPSARTSSNSQLFMVSMEKLGLGKLSLDKATIDKLATGNSFDRVLSVGSGMTKPVFNRPLLALSDFLSIMLFASIGKASHSTTGSLDLISVAITAFPFLLAWFTISPLVGSYDKESTLLSQDDPSPLRFAGVIGNTIKGWSLAIPVGCLLRGFIKGYIPPTPFVVVTLVSTAVILGGSRVLYSILESDIQELKDFQKW